MATNRMYLACSECEGEHLVLARLSAGECDWEPSRESGDLGEAIAAFIDEHRFCDDNRGIEGIGVRWESGIA